MYWMESNLAVVIIYYRLSKIKGDCQAEVRSNLKTQAVVFL